LDCPCARDCATPSSHHRGQSEVDKGSTFIIRFAPQSVPAHTASPLQPNTTLQNLRVLVVDDETMVRTIIGEYLAIDGHVVETANGGRDGLRNSQTPLRPRGGGPCHARYEW